MLIQRIKISNYKTYLDLDLDLSVDEERPIILIGGSNGGGKTTLFEAISGALYGLKIESREHFMELVNQGALGNTKPEISLQITFSGKVLGTEQKYILKRTYVLNPAYKPLESVSLNMNGNMFVYGTMTAPKERMRAEQEVNKIIKANLPQEPQPVLPIRRHAIERAAEKMCSLRPSATTSRMCSASKNISSSKRHQSTFSKKWPR